MKETFSIFQEKFIEHWQQYLELNKKLDSYRGKEIGQDVNEVNKLLFEIQENFSQMYPVLEFVVKNYNLSVAAINEYNIFIEDIKNAGGSTETKVAQS